LYVRDKIWAGKQIWKGRVLGIEMTPFQQQLITDGLRDRGEPEEKMTTAVEGCLGYAAIIGAEAFEEIDGVRELALNYDLQVGRCFLVPLCSWTHLPNSVVRTTS